MPRLAVLAVLASACSPYGGGAFNCSTDDQCGAGGKCFSGFCAFVDGMCDSGYKYGELSGPQSNACVSKANTGDGGVADAPPDGPPGQPCYGNSLVHACFSTTPTGTVAIAANTTVDTDTSSMCAMLASPSPSPWCVIAGQTIQVQQGFTLQARGSRPLVLIATGSITIAGTLDVASHQGGQVGASADAAGCNAGNNPGGSGGGQGGSFGGKGGNGGNPNGSTSGATLVPSVLRGGCPGANGNGSNHGGGGHGGGSTWLIAGTSIFVSGTIDASGEGGGPGTTNSSGGGGGGAGGLVGLECASVTIQGSVFANGGGGGEGSGTATSGNAGADPTSASAAAAGGANGSGNGGDGGDGSVGSTLDGTTGQNGTTAGGGGGGGAGYLKIVPNMPFSGGGSVSPPQT